jgi:hypothetical protein
MAIFKVRIRNIKVFESETLVEADTKGDAEHYLKTNCDWHDDCGLDDGGNYTKSLTLIENGIEEITSKSDIPENWGKGNRAWNGHESVEDILTI